MRLRKNHALQPKYTELAMARCKELVREAKKHGFDKPWICAQMHGEYDADCKHIVEMTLTSLGVNFE
jgi:hypothetical protein